MYRFSLPSYPRPAIAPAPDHDWQQAERILEILEREQAAPAAPDHPPMPPKPVGLDAWLSRPLRESDYLRAYGITPDDPFWDRYDPGDSKLGLGGGAHWRTRDFNPEQHGNRPAEVALFGSEEASASPRYPTAGMADNSQHSALLPNARAAGDDGPRFVAVAPHRSDRGITDEILAKLAKDEPSTAPDQPPAWSPGISNLFGLIGSAEAQARSSRGPRPLLTNPQQVTQEMYRLVHRRLNAVEPNNPMLSTIQPHGYVPNEEDFYQLWREWLEAEGRAARNEPPRPQGYLGPLPRGRGGETEFTIAGRGAHRERQEVLRKLGYKVERPLPSGKRIDATNEEPTPARMEEIRSDRPESIRRAEREAEVKAKELEQILGKATLWEVHPYKIEEFLRRILPKRWP